MGESDTLIVRIADRAAARDPRTHHYGAAPGLLELRELVAAQHHGAVDVEQVQVTVGTKHALHLALGAVTGPSDEVLVLRPTWPGHIGAVECVGAVVVEVEAGRDGLVEPLRRPSLTQAADRLDAALTGKDR